MLLFIQLGDGTPITPVDVETRVGSFPPNFVQELASGTQKLSADETTTAVAAAEGKEVEIEDMNLATLDFGELLKVATDLQRRVKEHKQVNLDLIEEEEIAQQERIIAVRPSLLLPLFITRLALSAWTRIQLHASRQSTIGIMHGLNIMV